jgi:hypothetical protein
MGGQSAIKLCVNRPEKQLKRPRDHARSNSSDKISTTRNVEGGGGAAVGEASRIAGVARLVSFKR